ncbi:MAG: MmcB family DNA repair protein [Alphaproteobacteria bacterium]|nr:MmcB family DNA repair protein [Alphaproteobacteria bacterium]
MSDQPNASTGESHDAAALTRGAVRLLYDHGYDCLAEFPLQSGRRADLIALNRGGEVLIVEVKSSLADFRSDQKWPEYLEWCDGFFFAVAAVFPRDVLPADHGLIVADGYGGAILRDAPRRKLSAPRRRTMTLRFGLVAARRLQWLRDQVPEVSGGPNGEDR